MNAAQPAGGEHFDPGLDGQHDASGNSGRSMASSGADRSDIRDTALPHDLASSDGFDGVVVEADKDLPGDDGDHGGDRTRTAHRFMQRASHAQIFRVGESVGDDGRLQSNDRRVGGERLSHFFQNLQRTVHDAYLGHPPVRYPE